MIYFEIDTTTKQVTHAFTGPADIPADHCPPNVLSIDSLDNQPFNSVEEMLNYKYESGTFTLVT
jgi:hypothetical protein